MVIKQEASSGLWKVLFFILLCQATFFTRQLGGGTSLVTDDPTMKQVIQEYIVPVVLWSISV